MSTFILIHSPVQPDWPDAPCAYLQFSPFYDRPATQARAAHWPVATLPGNHFALLNAPSAVVDAILALVEEGEA